MKNFTTLLLLCFALISKAQIQIGQDITSLGFGGFCGESVAISSDGNIIAVTGSGSSPSRAYVYQNENGNWQQLGDDIIGDMGSTFFRVDLSSDGSIVAVGSYIGLDHQVNIYELIDDTWTQIGQTIEYGLEVKLSSNGQIIAIADSAFDGLTGQVRIYENIDNNWTLIGQALDGENSGDAFGSSLSLSGDGTIVAISAPRFNDDAGQAKIFQNIDNSWSLVGVFTSADATEERFGTAISLSNDGSILVATNNKNDDNSAAVFKQAKIFQNTNGTWNQLGNTVNENLDQAFGTNFFFNTIDITADGQAFIIGSASANDETFGQGDIYQFDGNNWNHVGNSMVGDQSNVDQLGISVAISGDGNTCILGAPYGTNGCYARVFDISDVLLSTNDAFAAAISIYPNPVNDFLSINTPNPEQIQRVEIYDYAGSKINEFEYSPQIPVQHLSDGLYVLKITSNNERYRPLKFLKL